MSKGEDVKIKIDVEADAKSAIKELENINKLIDKLNKVAETISRITAQVDLQDNATRQAETINSTLEKLDNKIVTPQVKLKANEIMDTSTGEIMQINGMDKWQEEMASSKGSGGGGGPPNFTPLTDIPEPPSATPWYETGKNISKSMMKTGAAMSLALTAPLLKAGKNAVGLAVSFDSAMTGVRKTTDMTDAEFDQMGKSIRKMSKEIPATADEIAGVAEIAGQLGVPKKELLEYSRAMIDMGESTNLSAEVAAESMARFSNITGLDITAENANKLGSTIVALGNNFATSEADIMAMGMRLAGTGVQVGLTEAQILGMSAAMSSAGINAEAGGSSMSRVMQKINTEVLGSGENLSNFAKVAGMSAQDFSKSWKENPQEAITSFVKGLDEIKQAGGDVAGTLKEMDINSSQEIDTLARLSGAHEMLSDAMNQSGDAWEKGTALSAEAQQRYESAAAQFQVAKNKISDAFREVGIAIMPTLMQIADGISGLVEKFAGLDPGIQGFIVKALAIAFIAGPIIMAIAGVVGAISTIGGAFSNVGGIFSKIKDIFTGTGGAATLLSGKFLLIIGIIAAVVAAGILIYQNWDTIKAKAAELGAKIAEVFGKIKAKVVEVASNIGEKFSEAFSKIGEFLGNIGGKIKEGFGDALEWVGDKVQAVKDKFGKAKDWVKDKLGMGDDKEKQPTMSLEETQHIMDQVNKAKQTLTDFSSEAPTLIQSVVTQMEQLSKPLETFETKITEVQTALETLATSALTTSMQMAIAFTLLGTLGAVSFTAITIALTLFATTVMTTGMQVVMSLMLMTSSTMLFGVTFNAAIMSATTGLLMFTLLVMLMVTTTINGLNQILASSNTTMSSFVASILQGAVQAIQAFNTFRAGALGVINSMQGQMYSSGLALMTTLASGISAGAGAVTSAVAGVMAQARAYLPSSDAKKGPLSHLTMNGIKLIGTIAEGVHKGSSQLSGALNDELPNMDSKSKDSNGDSSNLGDTYMINIEVKSDDNNPEAMGQNIAINFVEALKKIKNNKKR